MNSLALTPIPHPLAASVRVPGSKSLTNRALLIAALADGLTTLTNALFSDDSRYFAESLVRLGFQVQLEEDEHKMTVVGLGGRIPSSRAELFIGNSGTTSRFLTAMLTLGQGDYVLDGNARMRERPIADLLATLRQLGAQVESSTGCPPVSVKASGLPGGRATIAGNLSSQFLSGLLLIAPYAQAPVELVVTGELNSKPYVDMTLAVMSDFGVGVERDGYERFRIAPQRYHSHAEYVIESDASAASYFFAAPALLGGTVHIRDISRRSRQGDIDFLDVLIQMGCTVTEADHGIEVTGPAELRGLDVDMRDIPDTAQTLAAIAPFASSPTIIRGIASARVKETDRVSAMVTELRRMGVTVDEYPDGLKIYPCADLHPASIQTYDDHRMAMAFALVGLKVPGVQIENPGCVSKTFPNYFEVVEELRSQEPEVRIQK